jgi:hypothetical protein
MSTPAADFERELEVFRTEVESGIQFFYAHLAIHAVAASKRRVFDLLNETPLFWNTCAGALQTAAFIALGRIFDQNSTHNVDKLLSIAQRNPHIFSKGALSKRKQNDKATPPDWLDEFIRNAYEPTAGDFRAFRAHVKKWRTIYESNYRDVRRKWFAHKEVSDQTDITALFARANIRELQQLFAFLSAVHEALWQLFSNGSKPVLRRMRYSVKRMRRLPSPKRHKSLQERITNETEQVLLSAARR